MVRPRHAIISAHRVKRITRELQNRRVSIKSSSNEGWLIAEDGFRKKEEKERKIPENETTRQTPPYPRERVIIYIQLVRDWLGGMLAVCYHSSIALTIAYTGTIPLRRFRLVPTVFSKSYGRIVRRDASWGCGNVPPDCP